MYPDAHNVGQAAVTALGRELPEGQGKEGEGQRATWAAGSARQPLIWEPAASSAQTSQGSPVPGLRPSELSVCCCQEASLAKNAHICGTADTSLVFAERCRNKFWFHAYVPKCEQAATFGRQKGQVKVWSLGSATGLKWQ